MRDNARVAKIPVDRLRANPENIRTDLGDLRELTASIRAEGVLVPLMAEDHGPYLVILHGHRRWASAQLAGLAKVPVVVVDPHDASSTILLMLAEDKKSPISKPDKQRAVLRLRELGMTWQAIADRLGVSYPTVLNWAGKTSANQNVPTGSRRPQVTPRVVHALLERLDAGELGPADLIAELRDRIGDWAPHVKAAS